MIPREGKILIRAAEQEDFLNIAAVNRAAFGRGDEAELVDRLRRDGEDVIELVALERGEISGHIMFSRLPVVSPDKTLDTAALAPMAVRPDRQKRGIGAALVNAGIEACRDRHIPAIVVLGHPEYYPRFGFSAEAAAHLKSPFTGPAFMALELMPGALALDGAEVRYPPAFGL